MKKENEFKPYIPPEKNTAELTFSSILSGIILAVVFGAANAYLGLRVGMTVSASIPSAVIGMGVIRIIMKKNSILESNMVQTIGSAGESLAAGAIFTLPALYLWAKEGLIEKPSLTEITTVAIIGGLLGTFFMIPLRNALIVREHNTLPYPEGHACAKVMLAGENKAAGARTVFAGMGVSGLFKLITDGLKLTSGEVNISGSIKTYPTQLGTQIYPAVISVGYICGPKISSYMLAGGVLSWLVLIPVIVIFGYENVMYPAAETVGTLFETGGASAIWSSYIRYIGAGALAAGGIISLVKSLPLILRTLFDTLRSLKHGTKGENLRTERDIAMKIVLSAILVLTLLVWLVPAIPVSLVGALIVVIFGFFFATISSRMVGLVGSSNNPISGMAIATLLAATFILKITGDAGARGMQSAIAIGSIICIVSAIAGDTSQDLKTGYLLGATPIKQQIGQLLGVIAAALAIGVTLNLLDTAWGFGSEELAAPQATLMKMVVEGIMGGTLAWPLIFIGIAASCIAEILGVPVLPFAIGIYLPVQLSACIMIGGLVRLAFDKIKNAERRESSTNRGILFCSGMIAGEGIVGILLAILAILNIPLGFFSLSPSVSIITTLAALVLTALSIPLFCLRK